MSLAAVIMCDHQDVRDLFPRGGQKSRSGRRIFIPLFYSMLVFVIVPWRINAVGQFSPSLFITPLSYVTPTAGRQSVCEAMKINATECNVDFMSMLFVPWIAY